MVRGIFFPSLSRFLQVKPACPEDETLLGDVLSFLNTFFKRSQADSDDQDLKWLLELLLKQVTGHALIPYGTETRWSRWEDVTDMCVSVGQTCPAGPAARSEDARGPSERHSDSTLRTSTAERADLAVQHTTAEAHTHLREVRHAHTCNS